ncbi:recombinase family protein [Dendrosporobacter sp. 1207_IL3150]|uniref:recombinase family protein n=1 Tax=Dendrosporobacter sp. 1207_IL3150 TaxID=3084054 RepID=UPI002FDA1F43
MNAAIYVRVSTDQQAEKGYSIDTQLEACRKCAFELGATSIEEFIDDGYSGEFIDRPALTSMREKLMNKHFDLVIAYAPDRLARKTIHLLIISEEINKAGALRRFASVNFEATSEGELMYKFQGIVAEYEKEKIKERTMRGKRGKASKGFVISNAKPFGYDFDKEKSTYIINDAEAEIIKMIFDFIVKEKMGTARICKELNARGIPSPRAKKSWIVSSVHRIITNTIYKGIINSMKYRYEKIGLNKKKRTQRPESEWITIKVPAIIDEFTWQAAQRQLQENKDRAKRNLKRDYLLNGYVVCAKCGRAMVISHSGCNKAISYYACLSQKSSSYVYSGQQPCIARQVPTKILDAHVFEYLLELCHNPDRIAEYIQAISPKKDTHKHKAVIDQMIKVEKEILQQRDTVMRWFRQKMLSESEAEIQLKDIRKQLADIAQMKNTYESELDAVSPARSATEIADTIKMNLNKDSFTIHEKRVALQAVLDKVIVERVDDTRGRGSRPEIHVQIKLK